MRQILLGTSNPAKASYFAHLLQDYDVSFLLLKDLGIEKLPDEAGKSPLENAMMKAAYYGRFHDWVISADSALYIRELPLDDPRQPGLTVRRRTDGGSMDDEEMIAHYSALAHTLGGRMTCYYQNGYGVCSCGAASGFLGDSKALNDVYSFHMVDKPHPNRVPGWPLDSISIQPGSGLYFVEDRDHHLSAADEVLVRPYWESLLAFFAEKLELERRLT